MDTVLGLSMTATAVGYVLVEGRDAAGPILDHADFTVRNRAGVRAVNTSAQLMSAVLRAEAKAIERGQRLQAIGVTWSDDAAAEAALLLEAVTDAQFDNVVPVRSAQAGETVAQSLATVVGYEKTAVCVLGHESTSVVMVDGTDDATRTAVRNVRGGHQGLCRWLATMFKRANWQPDGVIVLGHDVDLDAVGGRLEEALPVPVFTQPAGLALARGAALACAQGTQFADVAVAELTASHAEEHVGTRPLAYAGGLAMLVAGALTFVASLSVAVGMHVTPPRESGPVENIAQSAGPPSVAKAVTPLAPPPAATPPPAAEVDPPAAAELSPEPVSSPVPPTAVPNSEPEHDIPDAPPPGPPAAPAPPQQESNGRPPILARVLEHIPALHDDPAPQPPDDGSPSLP